MKRNAVLVLKPHFGKVEHRTQQGRAAFLPEQLRAHVDLHAYIEPDRAVTTHPGTIDHRSRVRIISAFHSRRSTPGRAFVNTPHIITNALSSAGISSSTAKSSAMFVSGPMVRSTTSPGWARMVWRKNSTA